MKHLVVLTALLSACSSGPVRKTERMEKWTAPEMRIAVYSPDLPSMSQSQVQDALQETGRFWIVSRGEGLKAIFSEQEMLHRDQMERFENKEKWAHWGKAHGVGAVMFAQNRCQEVVSYGGHIFLRCQQSLSMIDATTGEVIASALETVDGEVDRLPPAWTDTVEKLVKHIPRMWVEKVYEGRSAERQVSSEEHGKAMQKKHAVKTVANE